MDNNAIPSPQPDQMDVDAPYTPAHHYIFASSPPSPPSPPNSSQQEQGNNGENSAETVDSRHQDYESIVRHVMNDCVNHDERRVNKVIRNIDLVYSSPAHLQPGDDVSGRLGNLSKLLFKNSGSQGEAYSSKIIEKIFGLLDFTALTRVERASKGLQRVLHNSSTYQDLML